MKMLCQLAFAAAVLTATTASAAEEPAPALKPNALLGNMETLLSESNRISYAIGVAQPTSFYVDLHGADTIDPAILEAKLPEMIGGATPRAIREHLQLNRPIYARTAAYGHFGRQPDNEGGFSWEKTDLVDALKALA